MLWWRGICALRAVLLLLVVYETVATCAAASWPWHTVSAWQEQTTVSSQACRPLRQMKGEAELGACCYSSVCCLPLLPVLKENCTNCARIRLRQFQLC
jgi:hypothetical protein